LKGGIVDFNPCLKHKLIRKTVREFAENEIRPIAAEIDHNARFPEEIMQKMRGLNYFGLQAPREMGGAGLDSISYAIVVEELSRVAAGVGLCITVHNSVAVYPLLQFGTPEQKKRLLPGLISGERIGAFCLTEANAGSDAGGVETLALKQEDGYVINGAKIFVTNGGVCGLALIFAVTDPDKRGRQASVLIVEKEREGFQRGRDRGP
jgi:butyryl-CoA dehydrogenase